MPLLRTPMAEDPRLGARAASAPDGSLAGVGSIGGAPPAGAPAASTDLDAGAEPLAEYSLAQREHFEQLCVMLDKEVRDMPSRSYIEEVQAEVEMTPAHRRLLMDWLTEFHEQYGICPVTVEVAINLVDRFLSARPVALHFLQLVAIAAIHVACKAHESRTLRVNDLHVLSGRQYTPIQIHAMELQLLHTLSWRLVPVTPLQVLDLLANLLPLPRAGHVRSIAEALISLADCEYAMLRYRPSVLALGALCVALVVLRIPETILSSLAAPPGEVLLRDPHLQQCRAHLSDLFERAMADNANRQSSELAASAGLELNPSASQRGAAGDGESTIDLEADVARPVYGGRGPKA